MIDDLNLKNTEEKSRLYATLLCDCAKQSPNFFLQNCQQISKFIQKIPTFGTIRKQPTHKQKL